MKCFRQNVIAAMGLLMIHLTGCANSPVNVPVVVEKQIPVAPVECTKPHPLKLKPLPLASSTDTFEQYLSKIVAVQRANGKLYQSMTSDYSVCQAYVNGLHNASKGL